MDENTRRVLVCDDDEAISEMIKIMLEDANFQVKLLFSGKSIQKQVKAYKPDLILIDLWMPGIDGKDAINLLRKDQETKDIPIIIISALHENEINRIVKSVQANGYLSKPFHMKDLLSTVEKYTIFPRNGHKR